jgi:microcystin-dependent protein
MAKFFVYPFASTVTNRAAVPNTSQDDGSISYVQGLGPNYSLNFALGPPALPIDRKQSNQVFYDITNGIRQYQTHGQPDFITSVDNGGVPFPYEIFAHVRYDDGGGVKVYENQSTVNINDPTSPTWQVISGDPIPSGGIVGYAGATPPISDGYLVCDGSPVSRTLFPFLFAAIGITWGPGDGSTTFNLPDMQRRIPVGVGGTDPYGLLPITLGSYGGVASVTLTYNQMAKHTHAFVEGLYLYRIKNIVTSHSTHGEQDFTPGTATQTGSAGSGGAHPNIQQSAVMYWLIKT